VQYCMTKTPFTERNAMSCETADTEIPFSNGEEYYIWRDNNCDLCKYAFDENTGVGICEFEHALDAGYFGDGRVNKDYLAIMGLDNGGSRKCKAFSSFDGILRNGTFEYEQQRAKDLRALEKWSGRKVVE